MRWERTEYKEVAPCACGKGTIVRLAYTEDDDWNRSRSGIINEKIACENCRTQYHIEHVIRHYSCPSWKGDGISDKAYLVPNSLTIPEQISEKHFSFNVEEEIVSIYSYDEIKAAKADMMKNKYSTRLELENSRRIVSIYEKRYKKKRLAPIIDMLCSIEQQYDKYEWTPEKIAAYRDAEKESIRANEQEIAIAIKQSVPLEFRRVSDDKV